MASDWISDEVIQACYQGEMHAPHSPPADLLPVETLLMAYRSGVFPMADSRKDEELYWVEPRERGIFPLDGFHVSRSLAKTLKQDRYTVTCNRDFAGVIAACAQPRPDHPETWINRRIEASYHLLHHAGHAHSIECWQDEKLVGGLYGVSFDRVFCGESMFSRADNASKVALAWLVALMKRAGYQLLDCQFMTEHLASLGAASLSGEAYLELLVRACKDGFAADLPAAHAALLEEAQSLEGAGTSSPGKLIAQSFIHTS